MTRARFRILAVFALGGLTVLWERLWQSFWPVASLVLFYGGLALLGLWQKVSAPVHLICLCLFAAAAFVFIWRGSKSFQWPRTAHINLRIEQHSGLRHRPLATIIDRLPDNADETAQNVFLRHQARMAQEAQKTKIPLPRRNVVSSDKYYLRHAVLLIFILGLVIAKGASFDRLQQGFAPDIVSLNGKNASFDLWIEPPEYTHKPTIFLAHAKEGLIDAPAGSMLKFRANGYRFAPGLHYAGKSYALPEISTHSYALDIPLATNGELRITSLFSTLGGWQINATQDSAPRIVILKAEETPSSALKITYDAQDDYGVKKITAHVVPTDETGESADFDIPPGANGETAHTEDLTSNLSAGLPVMLRLEAEDGAGHKTVSEPLTVTLPERQFENVISRRLIEDRKSLKGNPSKEKIDAAMRDITDIVIRPQFYRNDTVVFLALSMSARRLIYDDEPEAVRSVIDILWEVALKLEDNGLSLAKRDLREALQKMTTALNDKSLSEAALQEMAQDLQQKMQAYVGALAQALNDRIRAGKKLPVLPSELARKLTSKNIDIGEMLERMRRLTQSGNRDELQAMARALENSLGNLDLQSIDKMQETQAKALESLQNLEEIVHRQQSLIETTERADDDDIASKAKEQSDLRNLLGDSLRQLGEAGLAAPKNFAAADQEMKLSQEALKGGTPQASLPHQRQALQELQKGLDQATEAMAQALQQSILSFGMMPGGEEGATDPLGRPWRGTDQSDVTIPDKSEQRRAQEIIRLLRERANDPGRSQVERNYLDRLLKHFQ